MHVTRWSIDIDDAVLAELRGRLRRTRLPVAAPGEPWGQGTDLAYLQNLLAYWCDGYDWRAQQEWLDSFPQFRALIDGAWVHFVHVPAVRSPAIPLVLTHGWPSGFLEYLGLVPLLTDPDAHGIDGPAFDLVIPSLPGYGFSERADRPVTYRDVAHSWHRLMQGLGYQRYAAGGTDFGAGVATLMALEDPERLVGLHLTHLELSPYTGPGSRPLSAAERAFLEQASRWREVEGGYIAVQSTKPQTLAYALNDSPAGLAAWILEKWRSWSDCRGDLESRFSRDFLLTVVTLYWITQTITTSMRDYYDNRHWQPPLSPHDVVRTPTAVAVFPHMLVPEGEPPREWAERLYNVGRWTRMPSGGHFAPAEEPDLVARDIVAFFTSILRQG
jgi:pimeloyl-ACP methyl ester carboxylesterase